MRILNRRFAARRTRLGFATLAALASAGVTMTVSASSSAATNSFGSTLVPVQFHDANGGCLDLPNGNTTNGTKLQIWSCDGDGVNQTWYMDPGGAIHFGADASKCLDLPNGSQVNNARLQIWDCDNGSSQDQQWAYGASGTLQKITSGVAGKCVELLNGSANNGNVVQLYDCNGTSGQTWFPLNGSQAQPVQLHDVNGGCLDLPNGNTANGTFLQIWACDGDGLNQSWYSDAAGAIHYAANPGKCIDLPNGNQADHARLQIWDCDNGSSQDQQWRSMPDHTLRKFSNGAAGKCVELLNGSANNGNIVQLYDCNGTTGQEWLPNVTLGSWSGLTNQPSFSAETALLLTDGTILVHAYYGTDFWRLTPDANGSYVNGTWSQLASLPSGYSPLYFGSAVLPDGRVLIAGGEYNGGVQNDGTLAAIYDPVTNRWTSVSAPSGWANIGDASTVILPNGTLMLADCCSSAQALFNPSTLTWTTTGTGKADGNDEEGWTLLPSGKVLTIDTTNGTNSELYDPSTGRWSLAGSTVAQLVDTSSEEIGPALLMPNGRLFAAGATSHTASYSPGGAWMAGPDFPTSSDGQLDCEDAPAALLPNGHVLLASSPGTYQNGVHFLDFDGAYFTEVARTSNAPNVSSFNERFLLLPTGQVMATDSSKNVQVYQSIGYPRAGWAPTITSIPSSLSRGGTVTVNGTQFNGLSQAVAYGDDAQAATNYPLVRITNNATHHVFYGRTHSFSTMAVATGGAAVSTSVDIPWSVETGASVAQVVANGLASAGVSVNIQ
ncbi:MAG TPA: ricin-type beta-trefoil lectin domain protein [Polyangiaceae bacterium]|jgi:hypothetical protein